MTTLTRARNGSGEYVRSPETVARDAQAAELLAHRRTYQQIGDELGMTRQAAKKACERAMRDIVELSRESTEGAIALEDAKLDAMEAGYLEILQRKHFHISPSGRIVRGWEGEEVLDDGPSMNALQGLLKVSESRRKLHGWNAPTRNEVTGAKGGPIEITDVRETAEGFLKALAEG